MRVCIVGLGAVGGLIAVRLARAGITVSAVARGHTLETVRRDGLTLLDRDAGAERAHTVRLPVSADPRALGAQDLVVLAVKTTGLVAAAPAVEALLGPRTAVLSTMNGVPWWFFHGLPGAPAGIRLESVDPGGAVSRAIPADRVIGCVTHLSSATVEPGVVRHALGERLIVGEPDGSSSPRCTATIAALRAGGFEVESSRRIQQDIWFKLWGNMTMNPISALTGATGDRMLADDEVRHFISRCMREASAIGARIGLPIDVDPEQRHEVTRKLGAFRTSMLQDVEARRPLELDALVGAVIEIGRQVGVATPNIDALFGLSRLFARTLGLYPEAR